jgi:hypothetical protein
MRKESAHTGEISPTSRAGEVEIAIEPWSVRTIDERLRAFVAWHGEIPPDARRIDDGDARTHAATWVRRNIGDGVAGAYVIGFESGKHHWWTLFFERTTTYQPYPEGAERWHIEAYDDLGESWIGNYYYWPAEHRWRHVYYHLHGDDYGRHPRIASDGDPGDPCERSGE